LVLSPALDAASNFWDMELNHTVEDFF